MPIGTFRRWAADRVPISPPAIVELKIQGSVHDFGRSHLAGQVEFPLLNRPKLPLSSFEQLTPPDKSPDLTELRIEILPTNFALEAELVQLLPIEYSALVAPKTINLRFSSFDDYPATVDVFHGLSKPHCTGKAYKPPGTSELAQKVIFDRDVENSIIYSSQLRSWFSSKPKTAYKSKHDTKATRKARTLDVFDLLLPYLQPSLSPFLEQPILFPPDRRPYDYQIVGIKFLVGQTTALLGDEMGLGKTIQTIVALQILYRQGQVRETLILCPRSLLGNWERELGKWAPELFVIKVRGTQDERRQLWNSPASVYLTTYETLRNDLRILEHNVRDKSQITRFQTVILDEAQQLKNPQAEKSRAVSYLNANYRWGISGTPLENKLEDVTSIFSYLRPGLFLSSEYLTSISVRKKIAPYFLRRRTGDVRKELPPKVVSEIWLDLTDEQRMEYDRVEEEGKVELSQPGATRIHVFALINRLKQICNFDPASGESCKADYLTEILEDVVESGQKALVFSHLPQRALTQLQPRLQEFSAGIFDGSLSDTQRERLIKGFQEQDAPKILLTSVQAGGVGLNLTRANHVFHFDHWWNPAIARQAEARAHRIGQQDTVFVHDIYTNGTVEERIYDLLQEKQSLFNEVIDNLTADYVEHSISDEELFGLFGLKPPDLALKQEKATSSPTPLQDWKVNDLESLSPKAFEELVAKLYRNMGFKAEVTGQSNDGGIDVIARRRIDTGLQYLIIQCKHYPNGTVGTPVIRDLLGAWKAHSQATQAVIVTSGTFTAGAIELGERHQITLIDGVNLRHMIEQAFVSIV